jgi:O-antigen ligase
VIFLFVVNSRLADLYLSGFRVPLVTSLLALAAAVFTGGLPRALFSRVGVWLMAFSVWLVVAVPFSYWPGGSVQMLTDQWVKSFLVFVIVAGLLRSTRHCRIAMYAIGMADLGIVLLAFGSASGAVGDRLTLEQGVLSNPNALAHLLLMGLPFLLLMGLNASSLFGRAAAAVAATSVLLVVSRTGSRGAIVTIGCLVIVAFIRLPWRHRWKFIATLVVAASVVLPLVPENQRERYYTILSGTERPDEQVEAAFQGRDDPVGSTQARVGLLQRSVELTLDHPVFGVGPGMFQVAAAEYSTRRGERGAWHETHNTFTQVSSEAGLPGLLLFVSVIVVSVRISGSIHKATLHDRSHRQLSNVAYCLWLSTVIYAISVNFTSVAYLHYLPTLAGLALGVQLSAQAELGETNAEKQTTASVGVKRAGAPPRRVPSGSPLAS